MAIGIILGIVIALIFLVFLVIAGIEFYHILDNYDVNVKNLTLGIIGMVVAFVCFITIPFSFHTIQTGEVAVVKHLGKAKEVRTAGTYFDFWMVNSYQKYDAKVQNLDIVTAAYSSDAQTMTVQMTVQYQIMSDKALEITSTYGNLEILQNRIQSVATEKVKAVLSAYKAMSIIENRATMSPDVEKTIREAIGDEYFVDVVAVVLTNIDFSDAFELAVEEKMIAEQTKLKAEYENETKIAQAEAEAAAKLKAAEAEIEIAKARAEAAKIEAEGEAAANKIVSESLTQDIIDKIYAEAWDGKMPSVIGNSEVILPSDIMG